MLILSYVDAAGARWDDYKGEENFIIKSIKQYIILGPLFSDVIQTKSAL